MNLKDIKNAIDDGLRVYHQNPNYQVKLNPIHGLIIKCNSSGHFIGLTHADGVTMNGKPQDFYIDPLDLL